MSMKLLVGQIGKQGKVIEEEIEVATLAGTVKLHELIEAVIMTEVDRYNRGLSKKLPEFIEVNEENKLMGRFRLPFFGAKKVGLDEAIENGLLAFKDGIYMTFVDKKKIEDLDSDVKIQELTRIMFVKLTFIATGYGISNWI